MKLINRFAKAANKIVHDLVHSKGSQHYKDEQFSLLSKARRHEVLPGGKVRQTPIELARYKLSDIMEATKGLEIPKITMLVRGMQKLIMGAPQQQLKPVRVHVESRNKNLVTRQH